jgi:tetratricopeptide (TPR) repeat protein
VTTPVDDLMAALHQADAAIQSGRYQEARRLLDQTLAAHPDAAKAHYLHGVSLAMLGERREAHAGFVRAAELAPGDAALQCYAAAASREFGRAAEAMQYCRAALAADPNCGPAYALLAAVELPGEHYMKLLERIHAHLRPRTYIEIGIFAGASFGLAGAPTAAIGIDPEPRLASPPSPRHRIFRQTSDAFFAEHDVAALFGGVPVELALIDGMHHFEFALRDFVNLERCSAPQGTILVHDCYPIDAVSSARERLTEFWSGDVWRLILALRKWRPELVIHTVAVPPTGLAVVRNLDPGSRVLAENLERVCAEFLAVGYDAIADRKREALNVCAGDWEQVRRLLDAPPRPG